MSNTARIIIMVLAILAILFVIANYASASSYPPNVQAVVKLKRAVTYPDGMEMSAFRKLRVKRNLHNAYKKNSKCGGVQAIIGVVGYQSTHGNHGLAMGAATRAINQAYKCSHGRWRRKYNIQ